MLFESVHIAFKDRATFTEKKPPSWLISDCALFFEQKVKKLQVGDKVRTVFHTIKRVA